MLLQWPLSSSFVSSLEQFSNWYSLDGAIYQPIRGRELIWKLAVLASNIKRSESSVRTASTILFLERKASCESASYGATIHLKRVFTHLMAVWANQSLWFWGIHLKTRLRPLLRQSSLTALFIAGEIVIPFDGVKNKNDQMVRYLLV